MTSNLTFTVTTNQPGQLTFRIDSGDPATSGRARILGLAFDVQGSATPGGESQVTVEVIARSPSGENLTIAPATSTFRLETGGLPGDVNDDGTVNATDRSWLESRLPDWHVPTEDELMEGDLNGSGTLDAADLVLLQELIEGRPIYQIP